MTDLDRTRGKMPLQRRATGDFRLKPLPRSKPVPRANVTIRVEGKFSFRQTYTVAAAINYRCGGRFTCYAPLVI